MQYRFASVLAVGALVAVGNGAPIVRCVQHVLLVETLLIQTIIARRARCSRHRRQAIKRCDVGQARHCVGRA
jgi:hypothetical protein